MAAPPEKTTKNLTGKWNVNYTYSDSSEPGLIIQGISYLVRKGILAATLTLETNQYEAAPNPPNEDAPACWHVDIVQSASGMSTEERRCLDNTFRQHSDWLFGNVRGRSTWVGVEDIEDEYLKRGWLVEGEKALILSHAESEDYGWVADQIWGFQEVDGQRRHCRNIVVAKDAERAEFRFVYDYEE
ncbi:hypothetical protein ISF_04386 [Cordyceps fumosorosea ARSEF 2679]|uniref:LCCL domain-containing protein n=1 Tax=Cordyceps fumosorosea (strain ARSEF 2679) TaxID=1081104 RepID=A0A167XH93_CORFA|nr:hypothetical protein ISF_04386 [Cordyceps fumosorosea ARSEF 2679]OAA64976.1 hypothetical protein ISF_04386 [Cordyceps fumosorosea ARSEF 2679]